MYVEFFLRFVPMVNASKHQAVLDVNVDLALISTKLEGTVQVGLCSSFQRRLQSLFLGVDLKTQATHVRYDVPIFTMVLFML